MSVNKQAHIRSAKAKLKLSKAMINQCQKTGDRAGFHSACEVRKEAERELAQLSHVVGEGSEDAIK